MQPQVRENSGRKGLSGKPVERFIFLGSKITADDDCSHEIKRHLLLKDVTHWKIPICWERLKAGGEGEDRG